MALDDLGRLKKIFTANGEAVLVSVQATALVQKLMHDNKLLPPAAVHVGQACLAALLLQGMGDPDDREKVELQWKNEGPFGNLFAEAIGDGKVRAAIANGQIQSADGEEASLKINMGPGLFQVRRAREGAGVAAWTGLVKSGGFVAEDVAHYLEQSEQKNCGVSLTVKFAWDEIAQCPRVESAVGYLVHILPVLDEKEKTKVLLAWDHHMAELGPLSQWALSEDAGEASGQIIKFLTGRPVENVAIDIGVQNFCSCSEERAARAIALLSSGERKSLMEKDDDNFVVMNCEFCGATYRISV